MQTNKADCIILGGGLVGSLLAISLAQAGLKIFVIDHQPPQGALQAHHDGRVSAIAYGSQKFLQELGLWKGLEDQACPLFHIRISDFKSRAFVHFTAEEVGIPAMGYMVENLSLRQELFRMSETLETLQWYAPTCVQAIETDSFRGRVTLEGGMVLEAPLVVGADGRSSLSRQLMGIKTRSWSYDQISIVALIHHTLAHENVAHEHFLPSGPLAILPLKNQFASSIVWSGETRLAQTLLSLPHEAFNEKLMEAFGPYLGDVYVQEKRWSYPLIGQMSHTFRAPRFALVGDSAHVIHPVAGQGLNLGIHDARCLSTLIKEAAQVGLDWGSEGVLKSYEKKRRMEALEFAASTHGVVKFFSSGSPPLKFLRRVGMTLIQSSSLPRKIMIRHASRI
jgi:2-octaprenyl-6-methoxyphenol hydroxylase